MRGYAERAPDIFTPEEIDLFHKATAIVAALPDHEDFGAIRCHELARFVAEELSLPFKDGFFGFVEHTWLWTEPYEGEGEQLWRLPNILDVYVPGHVPQVQLIHTTTALPVNYRFGPPRTDIREDVIETLRQQYVQALKDRRPRPEVAMERPGRWL